jgi:hypothetical protein
LFDSQLEQVLERRFERSEEGVLIIRIGLDQATKRLVLHQRDVRRKHHEWILIHYHVRKNKLSSVAPAYECDDFLRVRLDLEESAEEFVG